MEKFLIIIVSLLCCNISLANNLKIIDGDTIVLNGEKIRFSGIDTPKMIPTTWWEAIDIDELEDYQMAQITAQHREPADRGAEEDRDRR